MSADSLPEFHRDVAEEHEESTMNSDEKEVKIIITDQLDGTQECPNCGSRNTRYLEANNYQCQEYDCRNIFPDMF